MRLTYLTAGLTFVTSLPSINAYTALSTFAVPKGASSKNIASRAGTGHTLFLSSSSEQEQPCDIPEEVKPLEDLTSRKGSAALLRSATLTNANGNLIKLDDPMTPGTSVVIFLRHMG